MMHCESWACRRQGSSAPTVQAGRLGSCRRWCGLALSQPLGASARTLKLSAHEQCSRSATAPCSRAPPGVEQAAYHALSSVQSCALRPPDSFSSQEEMTFLRRLAVVDPRLRNLQGMTLRLLSKGDISNDCCAAAHLAWQTGLPLCLSNSRTQMPWQASADATAAAPHA